IESILAQTYAHFELVIVDDGSTDGSAGIVRAYAVRDTRIRPMFAAHAGRARSLNTAIAMARGELIARMDADDICLPQRFSFQLEWMRQANVDICGSYAEVFGTTRGRVWVPVNHAAICHEMLFRGAFLHPTVILHTE